MSNTGNTDKRTTTMVRPMRSSDHIVVQIATTVPGRTMADWAQFEKGFSARS